MTANPPVNADRQQAALVGALRGCAAPAAGYLARWAYYMRHPSIIAAVALSAFSASLYAADRIMLFGQGDNDTMYRWEIPEQRVDSLPRWSPSAGMPPLAIDKATQIADAWIKRRNPDVKRFALSSITIALASGRRSPSEEHWYYRLEFQPIVGGQRLYGGQFIAVVLFDGSVVEPKAERVVHER